MIANLARIFSTVLIGIGLLATPSISNASVAAPGIAASHPSSHAATDPSPDRVLVGDAWGDVSCHGDHIKTKAWGLGHPANRKIWVKYEILINGEFWFDKGTAIWTTSTGSWSIPTETHFTFLHGDYVMFLDVTDYNTGAYLNSDADSCTM